MSITLTAREARPASGLILLTMSLGVLIAKGAQDMEVAPWLLIFPSVAMAVTLMCFNFIGDGLRDAIDPKDH